MDRFVTCPECRKELLLPEKMLHKYVKCPECQAAFYAQEKPRPAVAPPRPAEQDTSRRPRHRREDDDRDALRRRSGPRQLEPQRTPWYLWGLLALPWVITLASGSGASCCLAVLLSVVGLLTTLARWSVAARMSILLVLCVVLGGFVVLVHMSEAERNRTFHNVGAVQKIPFPNPPPVVPPGPLGPPREPPPATHFDGLVGYWDFDEVSPDGEVPDRSGRGNHGKLRGMHFQLQEGIRGKAIELREKTFFDYRGSRDFSFADGGDFTHALWVKTTKREATLVSQRGRDDTGALLDLVLFDGMPFACVRTDRAAAARTVGLGDRLDHLWHHLALVRRGERLAVYLDGQFGADLHESGGPITTGERAVGAGRRWIDFPAAAPGAFPTHLEGRVDEFCIFNRALDDDEIRQLAGR
jgi:hypothetical protein